MAAPNKIKTIAKGMATAPRQTDPYWSFLSNSLPDPNPILARLGIHTATEIYRRVETDAHVLGDLRSIRSGLLDYEMRILAGDTTAPAKRARDMCAAVLARPPHDGGHWFDEVWNIAKSVFHGVSYTDVIWGSDGTEITPVEIINRPTRRFRFHIPDNKPRVLTWDNQEPGEPIPPRQLLMTKHMPDYDNPYGIAVFSSCIWPYLFKHTGYRYFVDYCEKYGVPFTLAHYPANATNEQITDLLDALQKLLSNSAGAVADGVTVEAVAPTGSSASGSVTPQERLINSCNSEMSYALTSQTLSGEVQDKGSFAAAQTHREREKSIHVSDRTMVSGTFNTLFRWITELNFGPDVAAPTHLFYEESEARQEWATVIGGARSYLDIKKSEAYEKLGLTEPEPGDEVIEKPELVMPGGPGGPPRPGGAPRSRANFEIDTALAIADNPALADEIQLAMVAPIIKAAADDPDALRGKLEFLFPEDDRTALEQRFAKLLFVSSLFGAGDPDNAA